MKSRILTAFFALIASLFASLSVAQEYTIRSGDLLRVEVLEDSSINREVLVAPDGRITIPLGGNLRVSGASLPEAARRITSALDDDFATSPTVVVSLLQLREDPVPTPVEEPEPVLYEVYVIGEVNDPGSISVEPGTTLLQALSLVGGVTDFAATKRIQLRRVTDEGERVYNFNYQNVLDGVSNVGLSQVSDGDVMVVPARRLFEN